MSPATHNFINTFARELELPYQPDFELDLSDIPKEPKYSVYEFGHLLDKRSAIMILLDLEKESEVQRFAPDEFEFGKHSMQNIFAHTFHIDSVICSLIRLWPR
jgi:hypothetical protein